jgi:hypothetical protein
VRDDAVEQGDRGGVPPRPEGLVDDLGGGGRVEVQPGAQPGHGLVEADEAGGPDVVEQCVDEVLDDLGVARLAEAPCCPAELAAERLADARVDERAETCEDAADPAHRDTEVVDPLGLSRAHGGLGGRQRLSLVEKVLTQQGRGGRHTSLYRIPAAGEAVLASRDPVKTRQPLPLASQETYSRKGGTGHHAPCSRDRRRPRRRAAPPRARR